MNIFFIQRGLQKQDIFSRMSLLVKRINRLTPVSERIPFGFLRTTFSHAVGPVLMLDPGAEIDASHCEDRGAAVAPHPEAALKVCSQRSDE